MKAIQIDGYKKGPVNVVLRDVDMPTVGENDVLVKVRTAAVNPLDILIAHGDVRLVVPYQFPLTMGNEMVGSVEKMGSKVSGFEVGDRVFARMPLSRIGTFAEYVSIDAGALAKVPSYLTDEEAAAVPLTALTGEQALDILNLKKGDSLFISGGSGSLGAMVIPLAVARGLKVSTSGGAKDRERVMALGVEQYYDYRTTDYTTMLENLDGAIDSIGDKELPRIFSILRRGATVVSLKGMPNGSFAKSFGMPLWKQWLFKLVGMKNDCLAKRNNQQYHFMFVTSDGSQLQRAASILEAKQIRPEVGNVYSLAQAEAALREVMAGQKRGKVIIKVADK
nr:NADP-dependent oxidoreductase [uncultured Prevotella sp.]